MDTHRRAGRRGGPGARLVAGPFAVLLIAGCGANDATTPPPPAATPAVTPVYSRTTGRLEALVSDRNGDGTADTRAVMDGATLRRVEIDRDGNGRTDRIEYYAATPPGTGLPPLLRAEELDAGGEVVRREAYERGVVATTEEDTDGDRRPDKWEYYTNGALARVELDFSGLGRPERRLLYGTNGERTVEVDLDGDGRFEPEGRSAPRNPR